MVYICVSNQPFRGAICLPVGLPYYTLRLSTIYHFRLESRPVPVSGQVLALCTLIWTSCLHVRRRVRRAASLRRHGWTGRRAYEGTFVAGRAVRVGRGEVADDAAALWSFDEDVTYTVYVLYRDSAVGEVSFTG